MLEQMLAAPGADEPWPDRVRARLAALLAATLRPEPAPTQLNMEIRDQALIGGIATLIVRRLNSGGAPQLPELLPDLTELALAPYLGRRKPSAKPPRPPSNPAITRSQAPSGAGFFRFENCYLHS